MTLLGLIGSLAVAAFVVAVLDGASLPAASPARAGLLVALTAGGAALALFTAYRGLRARTGAGRSTGDEVAELRKSLLTAEAIIKAEPQVLVFWEQGLGVRVMTHTLATIAGLPPQHAELLRFGRWLDLASAQELKRGLDALFADGRRFQERAERPVGTSRQTGALRAAEPSCACVMWPDASATLPASSTNTASSCATPSLAAPCSMLCPCRPGCVAPTAACNGSTRPM